MKASGNAPAKRLLNAAEAAEYIGRTEHALRQMVHRRQVPFVKCGRLLRFDVTELNVWIKRCTEMSA